LLKIFHRASKELVVAYNTAYKIYSKVRLAIYHFVSKEDTKFQGEVEADESYFGGKKRGKRGKGAEGKSKIPVFGILERQGKVKVEVVKDVSCELLMGDDKEGKEGEFNLHRQI